MKAFVCQFLYLIELSFKEEHTSHFRSVLFDVFCFFWRVIFYMGNGHLFFQS